MDPTGWELKVNDEDVRLTVEEPPEVPALKPANTVPFQFVGEYVMEVAVPFCAEVTVWYCIAIRRFDPLAPVFTLLFGIT